MKSVIATITLLSLLVMDSAFAVKPIYSGGRDRPAIRGYDPVAYFTENKPVKGSKTFSHTHNGATWLFSSRENLETFKANTEKYTPQYGGYCAYAVSSGSTASIKPEYFTIHDDKLYLNYSKSVHKKWSKDKDDYIREADTNWPKILSK
ncbi:MAG: YHS domain-containing protein [Arenicella sp.]|jgi:YHS domain-containing protein